MRYLFLALIPLLFAGCVIQLPRGYHSHHGTYRYDGTPSRDYRHDRDGYREEYREDYREYRR